MSELIKRARELANKANTCRDSTKHLVLAIEALCDALDEHQHSYTAPRNANLSGTLATTGPRRTTGAAAAAIYAKQQADKKKGTP